MCIAIYSPSGNAIPSDARLKTSFNHNRDGAGFAFNYQGKVHIIKGLMTSDELINALHQADEMYDLTSAGVLIHCRIGTAGSKNAKNTHPFPLTSEISELGKTTNTVKFAMIHNGIISLTNSDSLIKSSDISDTAVFVLKYLYPLSTNKNWMKESNNIQIISQLVGTYNKIAILNGQGEIIATPGFVCDNEDKNYYSNTTYKDYSYSYPSSYANTKGYGYNYDDDYYGCYGYDYECSRNYGTNFTNEEDSKSKNNQNKSTLNNSVNYGFIENDATYYAQKRQTASFESSSKPSQALLPSNVTVNTNSGKKTPILYNGKSCYPVMQITKDMYVKFTSSNKDSRHIFTRLTKQSLEYGVFVDTLGNVYFAGGNIPKTGKLIDKTAFTKSDCFEGIYLKSKDNLDFYTCPWTTDYWVASTLLDYADEIYNNNK